MKLGTIYKRAIVEFHGLAYDVAQCSDGIFSTSLHMNLVHWNEFQQWLRWQSSQGFAGFHGSQIVETQLDAPVGQIGQIFGVALNYRDHIAESGIAPAEVPLIFTKYVSAIASAHEELHLSSDYVDWEGELVVVIGRGGRNISADQAAYHIAGYTIGQDYSDRKVQMQGKQPQYSLAKSFAGFAPLGPWIVTLDEFDNPWDVELITEVNGEVMQYCTTGHMIHSVPALIEYISAIVELLPGDIIFTGTPAGTGIGQNPRRYLKSGDEVRTSIRGIGSMVQRAV